MVRAGDVPLDRAHAHARWAERYDAQGYTHRSAAHFGRAMHYAQVAQAFGAPKRSLEEADARDADLGDIVVGRWEDGAEVWTTLYSERLAAATRRSRMQQVLRGHGDTGIRKAKATTESAGSMYREIPAMLYKLYASESSGTKDSVHRDTSGSWYIHRCDTTSIVYLVPALLATDEAGVRDLMGLMRSHTSESPYKYALRVGLLIVQDKRPGRVRVKRAGFWEHATKLETFAYYDFLLRYPAPSHNYHFEKKARELDDALSRSRAPEVLKTNAKSLWTTVPSAYLTGRNEDLEITIARVGADIFVGNRAAPVSKMPDPISDWAWRTRS